MRGVAWTAVVILETILLLLREESLELDILLSVRFSLMALAIVNFPRPVLDAICLAERPDSEKIKILALIEVGRNFIV